LGSSPLRSDGSRNGQAGEAGPVEQSSAEAKSLKGLSVATPVGNNQGSQTGGQKGQIKDYSHDNLLKETSNGQKQLVRERALNLPEKRKDTYSMLQS
jgi:hypothetical protein